MDFGKEEKNQVREKMGREIRREVQGKRKGGDGRKYIHPSDNLWSRGKLVNNWMMELW